MGPLSVLSQASLLLFVLLTVAVFTLLERKLLSAAQGRRGPYKAGFDGLLQPLSDALKLLAKPLVLPVGVSQAPFLGAPLIMLITRVALWLARGLVEVGLEFPVAIFFVILGCRVYPALLGGASAKSKFAKLGALRSLAQTVSFEVSLMFLMIAPVLLRGALSLRERGAGGPAFKTLLFPAGALLVVTFLAELNRTPFDLGEAERELVSGFNTEFGGGLFMLFFLAEYRRILFMGALLSLLILGLGARGAVLVSAGFVWVRGALPRTRYDVLISTTWQRVLPASISLLRLALLAKASL